MVQINDKDNDVKVNLLILAIMENQCRLIVLQQNLNKTLHQHWKPRCICHCRTWRPDVQRYNSDQRSTANISGGSCERQRAHLVFQTSRIPVKCFSLTFLRPLFAGNWKWGQKIAIWFERVVIQDQKVYI